MIRGRETNWNQRSQMSSTYQLCEQLPVEVEDRPKPEGRMDRQSEAGGGGAEAEWIPPRPHPSRRRLASEALAMVHNGQPLVSTTGGE